MKLFHDSDHSMWGSKVNFVDENNVLLGYDMSQSCCEHAGWFIADTPQESHYGQILEQTTMNLDGWVFDKDFFKETSGGEFDGGGMAIFRIVRTNGEEVCEEKFIHVFNSHNGYYSHGFSFAVGDSTIQSGSL